MRRIFRLSGFQNKPARWLIYPAIYFLTVTFLSVGLHADSIPTGYQEATDTVISKIQTGQDQPHDQLVAEAAKYYKKNQNCKDGWVTFIEVKGGEKAATTKEVGGFDMAVKQLDEAAKAALDSGIIKKPTKDTLSRCYHSLILVPKGKTLKDASKLAKYPAGEENPNWTIVGDDKTRIQPEVKDDISKSAQP